MKALLIRALLRLLSLLPFRAAQAGGAGLGWLFWRLPNRARRTSQRNLARCYPHMTGSERRRLLRRLLSGRFVAHGVAWYFLPCCSLPVPMVILNIFGTGPNI
jgi:KDO2-lipid IV(A) lauroyltransferase